MSTRRARLCAALVTVALCLVLNHPLSAAITTTGDVTPDPNTTTSSDDLYIGNAADGTMLIDDDSDVVSRSSYLGYTSGVTGSATVDGAGSTWTGGSALYVGYHGTGTLSISGGGMIDIGSDLTLGHHNTGAGTLNLMSGTARLHGGALAKGDGTAMLDFTGGRLEGAGTIDLGAPLVQQGGTLAPGNSAGTTLIEGGYTLDSGALEIELNGLGTAGTDWDLVQVNGPVDLVGGDGLAEGMLDVVLGFPPLQGDEFVFLENDGTDPIIGAFATWRAVKARFYAILYDFAIDYTAGDGNDIALVTESFGPLGDYNGDGKVNAAGYTVWRDTLGATVAPYFGADGTGDGIINEADYDVWKTYFGLLGGSDSAVSGTVPEPPTAVLLVIASAAALCLLPRCVRRVVVVN